MAKEDLSNRDTWQDYSGRNAGQAEQDFFDAFKLAFANTDYSIRAKPQEFKSIYVDVELSNEVKLAIYTPDSPITKHGIMPDYAIDNKRTKKTLYVEVKRQDGWIEGKPRSAGRGNAHERSCKYFTPGLLGILRKRGNINPPALPFWTVFLGDITRDPCRVREVTCWFTGYSDHFFMWRDATNPVDLISHFNTHLKCHLEN
jgi:hypothetical protein